MSITLPMGARVGGSFTGSTVRGKLLEATALPASVAVIVMTVVPDRSEAGVTMTVRLLPLPLMTMLLVGTSAGFEELTVSTSELAGVSSSEMVKGIGAVAVSSSVD